jgi:hypothetical protein
MSDRQISRRRLIAVVAGAAMSPLGARAQQQSGRIPHIAYLGVSSPSVLDPRQIEQLKQGFAENGLVEGRNILSIMFGRKAISNACVSSRATSRSAISM